MKEYIAKEDIVNLIKETKSVRYLTIANTGNEALDLAYEMVGNSLDVVRQKIENISIVTKADICREALKKIAEKCFYVDLGEGVIPVVDYHDVFDILEGRK